MTRDSEERRNGEDPQGAECAARPNGAEGNRPMTSSIAHKQLIERLTAIDEEAMYQAPATTYANATPSGFDPSRGLSGEVLRPESCDPEIAGMMEKLSRLQGWLVLEACHRRGDPKFMAASTLIQDARVLLVERCFTQPKLGDRP